MTQRFFFSARRKANRRKKSWHPRGHQLVMFGRKRGVSPQRVQYEINLEKNGGPEFGFP